MATGCVTVGSQTRPGPPWRAEAATTRSASRAQPRHGHAWTGSGNTPTWTPKKPREPPARSCVSHAQAGTGSTAQGRAAAEGAATVQSAHTHTADNPAHRLTRAAWTWQPSSSPCPQGLGVQQQAWTVAVATEARPLTRTPTLRRHWTPRAGSDENTPEATRHRRFSRNDTQLPRQPPLPLT